VVDEIFVTALPEEFFYRGWLQARLKRVWPGGARIAGVVVGPAFLLTAALFRLGPPGHLPGLAACWSSFPALLFGWLRERTGTIVGSTLSTRRATSCRGWWPPRSARAGTPGDRKG
jgi:membrane protease YdiL (CAAX protease family)